LAIVLIVKIHSPYKASHFMKTNFLFFFFTLLFFFPSLAQQIPSSALNDLITESERLNLSEAQRSKLKALQEELVKKYNQEAGGEDNTADAQLSIEAYRDQ